VSEENRVRVLAAPALGERGGGIGQVSALLWRLMSEEWGRGAELVTLLRDGHTQPSASDKLRFSVALARHQMMDRLEWAFFSHLGLARVERYLPSLWEAPYGVFLHGIECWSPLDDGAREVVRRASLRVANSRFTAARALAANPDIGDVIVCPLALSPDAMVSTDPEVPDRFQRATVLIVGRLSATERYKGHEELIRAWPAILRRVRHARLVVVGEGDDRPRLTALAAELAVSEAVEFTGFVSRAELAQQYARAALFALPSKGEGFGLVYLEAMLVGLPCIGSIHDAAHEVIADGETGILVDPDDVGAMGERFVELLGDPARLRQLGEAGRLRARNHFSYENFRSRMTTLLRERFELRPRVAL
jgi:phosphatidyl-myo-inositol dimannoside synthase